MQKMSSIIFNNHFGGSSNSIIIQRTAGSVMWGKKANE